MIISIKVPLFLEALIMVGGHNFHTGNDINHILNELGSIVLKQGCGFFSTTGALLHQLCPSLCCCLIMISFFTICYQLRPSCADSITKNIWKGCCWGFSPSIIRHQATAALLCDFPNIFIIFQIIIYWYSFFCNPACWNVFSWRARLVVRY